jgi:hypothetical protein
MQENFPYYGCIVRVVSSHKLSQRITACRPLMAYRCTTHPFWTCSSLYNIPLQLQQQCSLNTVSGEAQVGVRLMLQ